MFNMKQKAKISILVFLIITLSLVIFYLKTTNITYKDNKGHISKLYCKLFKKGDIEKPVIFIPGIKGSRLQENDKDTWLTLPQVLKNTDPFIYNKTNKATGILDRIVIIPYIYEYSPYYLISSQFSCNNNSYLFSYDWRSEPTENVEKLKNLVLNVTHETGNKPTIIAHSMGGLITRYLEIQNSDLIEKIAYISTPFQPGISFFKDLSQGSETGLNKTINNKQAIQSYYSSYTLLPHFNQKLYEKNSLLSEDFWKSTLFKELNISNQEQNEIIIKLQKANDYHKVIDQARLSKKNNLYITSTCKNTLYSVEHRKEFHKPGDGRVTAESAIPQDYNPETEKIIDQCSDHDQQLNNTFIYKKLQEFVNQ